MVPPIADPIAAVDEWAPCLAASESVREGRAPSAVLEVVVARPDGGPGLIGALGALVDWSSVGEESE